MCSLTRYGKLCGAFFIKGSVFHGAKFGDAQNASGQA